MTEAEILATLKEAGWPQWQLDTLPGTWDMERITAFTSIVQQRAREAEREANTATTAAPVQPAPVQEPDPCPGCRKGIVCKTPTCGRLKLPADHPYRATTPAAQPAPVQSQAALDVLISKLANTRMMSYDRIPKCDVETIDEAMRVLAAMSKEPQPASVQDPCETCAHFVQGIYDMECHECRHYYASRYVRSTNSATQAQNRTPNAQAQARAEAAGRSESPGAQC